MNKNMTLLEKGIIENLKEKKKTAEERFDKNVVDIRQLMKDI